MPILGREVTETAELGFVLLIVIVVLAAMALIQKWAGE